MTLSSLASIMSADSSSSVMLAQKRKFGIFFGGLVSIADDVDDLELGLGGLKYVLLKLDAGLGGDR